MVPITTHCPLPVLVITIQSTSWLLHTHGTRLCGEYCLYLSVTSLYICCDSFSLHLLWHFLSLNLLWQFLSVYLLRQLLSTSTVTLSFCMSVTLSLSVSDVKISLCIYCDNFSLYIWVTISFCMPVTDPLLCVYCTKCICAYLLWQCLC